MARLRWYNASYTNTYTGSATRTGTGAITTSFSFTGSAHLRVYGIGASSGLERGAVLAGSPAITATLALTGGLKLRLYNISTASPTHLHIYNISAASAAAPKLRWTAVSALSATVAPVIAPFPEMTYEPLVTISVTATLAAGSSTPDSWTWRVISSPDPVVLNNETTDTVTFITPAQLPPNPGTPTMILGVQAIKDTVYSTEVQAPIGILPQLDWTWDGTSWVASKVTKIR